MGCYEANRNIMKYIIKDTLDNDYCGKYSWRNYITDIVPFDT